MGSCPPPPLRLFVINAPLVWKPRKFCQGRWSFDRTGFVLDFINVSGHRVGEVVSFDLWTSPVHESKVQKSTNISCLYCILVPVQSFSYFETPKWKTTMYWTLMSAEIVSTLEANSHNQILVAKLAAFVKCDTNLERNCLCVHQFPTFGKCGRKLLCPTFWKNLPIFSQSLLDRTERRA